MLIRDLIHEAHSTAVAKGWHERPLIVDGKPDPERVAAKLALIHSEITEAWECQHNGSWFMDLDANGKPEGFVVEVADVVIRVGDLCGALGIDLAREVDGSEHVENFDGTFVWDAFDEHLLAQHMLVSKGLEALRAGRIDGGESDDTLASALAKLVSECAQICRELGLGLAAAIEAKLAYNKTRPHRHGGKAV